MIKHSFFFLKNVFILLYSACFTPNYIQVKLHPCSRMMGQEDWIYPQHYRNLLPWKEVVSVGNQEYLA